MIVQYSNDKEVESSIAAKETRETLETVSTSDEIDSDSLAQDITGHLYITSENESSSAKMQTYSEVAAMPVKQDDSRTEVSELYAPLVEQTSSSYSTEKISKTYSEKQSARKCEIYI